MFKSDQENYKDAETVIGPSVKVEGNFSSDGDVVIEGQLTGTLKTTKNVRIGAGARIKAM
jgi:cytoskeletal protein CcmA (bactofilin family)